MKTITHDEIMKELIGEMERQHISKVETEYIMRHYEELVNRYLRNTDDKEEDLKIKIMSGITLERQYIPEQEMQKGMFKGKIIKEHFNIKASVSKYLKDFTNKWCFKEGFRKEWINRYW